MIVFLLAGCPYVFGPPDLSNVPDGEPDDTAAVPPEPDPTATTGDTGVVLPPGPDVVDLQYVPLTDALRLVATFVPIGALDAGGALVLHLDGVVSEVLIPQDLSVSGEDRLVYAVPVADPCSGIDVDLSVAVRDAAGAVGDPFVTTAVVPGLGAFADPGASIDLGEIALPLVWCGSTESPYDTDLFLFQVAADVDAVIALSWDSATDLDFTLYRDGAYVGGVFSVALNPEVLTFTLTAGSTWGIEVVAFGPPSPPTWMLAIAEAQ